jgi:predicted Rossmann fold nucleotide-binding protein DprA/Smf involved in DNA uptake
MTITELVQSIDERLASIKDEISTLNDARQALVHRAAPTKPAPRRASRSARARARGQSATSVMPAAKVEEILASSQDGMATAAIAKQGDAKPDQVLVLLRELEDAGKVRRSGQRRGTRWHTITDEDRIQARAAELAGRRRKGRAPSAPASGT